MAAIYVLSGDNGLVKVGMSENVEMRVQALRLANAIEFVSPDHPKARKVEIAAHKALAEFRYRGEWFQCSVARAIRAVTEAFDAIPMEFADNEEAWFGFRIDPALHAQIKAAAKAKRLSVRAYAEQVLRKAVEKGPAK